MKQFLSNPSATPETVNITAWSDTAGYALTPLLTHYSACSFILGLGYQPMKQLGHIQPTMQHTLQCLIAHGGKPVLFTLIFPTVYVTYILKPLFLFPL